MPSTRTANSSHQSLTSNWMGGYTAPEGYFDEFLNNDGQPRPHWSKISSSFGSLDQDAWTRRERQLTRLIHDNGITYNVYGETQADLRPWSMDMLPLAIPQAEIDRLESSLSQRAHLLNLILQDVYGRQTMLQSGKMHPYLVFANPSFLRPCHGLLPTRARHIHLYAADLARSPDGSWWVLSDRVEAASGLGYALGNRMLMSRIFPRVLWEADVLSLQPFIQDFCAYIESLAPHHTDNPNVALLTPGPNNETYFEQSFLARNLGYTLAEGADLTVRNNRLYMKTIAGVQPVDVLLRRVDSAWCDPLELRNESLLGVPGLVNAVRQGNLSVANALGSGFVETPAMLAFLQWFSRYYLGESLEIPSVATWWCGQESELNYVLDNLDSLVIKPTFWQRHTHSYFGPLLSSKEKEELIARIRARPELFCGQEIVSNATIPVYQDGSLHSRHFQLRVFMVPSRDGWRMMPGGLARHAPSTDNLVVSMQAGGESKDTWVLRDPNTRDRPRAAPLVASSKIRRNTNDLPSRTADNLFWLGRYIERTESQARLLRSTCTLLIDEIASESQLAALPFLEQLVPPGDNTERLIAEDERLLDFAACEQVLLDAIYSLDNPESLLANIQNIDRTASKVKERLSVDTWRRLQTMHDVAERTASKQQSIFDEDTLLTLDTVLNDLSGFIGNVTENMTRSQGWRFLQIGRRAERAISIGFLLESAFRHQHKTDESLLAKLLDWADSSITYRRRYLNTLVASSVLDLLCFDNSNPRSLAFQAESMRELLAALPHAQSSYRHPIDLTALRIYSRIGLTDPETMLQGDRRSRRKRIERFFLETRDHFMELSSLIEQHYFAHTSSTTQEKPAAIIG